MKDGGEGEGGHFVEGVGEASRGGCEPVLKARANSVDLGGEGGRPDCAGSGSGGCGSDSGGGCRGDCEY